MKPAHASLLAFIAALTVAPSSAQNSSVSGMTATFIILCVLETSTTQALHP